jgi:hypothetical protein
MEVMRRVGLATVVLVASLAGAAQAGTSHFGSSGAHATVGHTTIRLGGRAPLPAMRPAPLQQSPPAIVTRPMPPLRRVDSFPRHHHHRHDRGVVFVEPPFFGYSAFSPFDWPYAYPYWSSFYGYPYSSSFYSYAPGGGYAPSPSTIKTPYFCWVDQIGFTDESRFVHHLHEVHGVPLDQALAASEQIGERYVFFGY